MSENNDQEIIKRIKDGLDKLDRNIDVRTPNINQFRKLVTRAEEKRYKKLRKDALVFIICAIGIISLETFAFSKSIFFFIAAQIIALLSLPAGMIGWRRYKSRKVKTT